MAKGTTAFVNVSNTCLTARLAIAVFYVPLPTIENVEICWKRRKIGHYRAVQFSEREAVSISPKKALNASLCVADLIGMGFKTYRVADKPLPKPSVEGKSSPRYDKENKYDFIIIFLIKEELK